MLPRLGRDLQQFRIKPTFTKTRVSSCARVVWKLVLTEHYFVVIRPEVKENKEGADTEKAAEQSAEPEELVKEKVRISADPITSEPVQC